MMQNTIQNIKKKLQNNMQNTEQNIKNNLQNAMQNTMQHQNVSSLTTNEMPNEEVFPLS
jgi:BMFP domain-containing protein YqiC